MKFRTVLLGWGLEKLVYVMYYGIQPGLVLLERLFVFVGRKISDFAGTAVWGAGCFIEVIVVIEVDVFAADTAFAPVFVILDFVITVSHDCYSLSK